MLKLIALILTVADVQAAGGGHGGHISELILPAWNFVPLLIVMIVLLRKPISAAFTKNAEEVEALYNVAEEKDKEAQIKLDMYEKKMNSLKSESEKIMKETKEQIEKFEKQNAEETVNMIQKLNEDADQKVAYEKDQAVRAINASLVDQVISKAKSKINENKEYKDKVTNKLVSEI
ncbi:hypothetical protein BIY24_16275 [Halobacteriovorax marinus]|uniref:ATP synthase subunit b n=1 Tax=Halobacteriovorax marinus (strain ATCC BAA-682 / DSM 15412 / SJ) TaxID=862908 RepID=E1X1L3_HALMS|nr:ATP synthase F0 subunit B [Halobacteriovorax marinus]ATH09441.1 hypothetical protein BIY24_16275 [Halobacteriovorax marinus]CBW28181.1 putative ATP synthase B chain [Halobacteriovorax marinus SJ]